MKRNLLAILLGVFAFKVYAQTLTLRDPQMWWSAQGRIDSVTFSVRPVGAYMECGLYMNLTWGSSSYNDSVEVQFPFKLPKGAIVTDSWLWVGNQIVQAELMDRDRAHLVYESIVQRRQDPSILYKNSATDYELRVYPLPPNQYRRVKITYLLPVQWSSNVVQIPLPVDLMRASTVKPEMKVFFYTDSIFNTPMITGVTTPPVFQPVQGQAFSSATITSAQVNTQSPLLIATANIANGVYCSTYESSAGNGYFQTAVNLKNALNITTHRKVVCAVDYDAGNTKFTKAEVLAEVMNGLLQNYSETDSFNLVLSSSASTIASTTWLPCNSTSITNAFSPSFTNSLLSYTMLPSTISKAVDFINMHGADGEIIIWSSSTAYGSQSSGNNLIATMMSAMSPKVYKIHYVDFINNYVYYNYIGNSSYFGNSYFSKSITAMTGGEYNAVYELPGFYAYYSKLDDLKTVSSSFYESVQPKANFLDVVPIVNNGLAYAKFNSYQQSTAATLTNTYYQVGRYMGGSIDSIQITCVYNAQPISVKIPASTHQSDYNTAKMWGSAYLDNIQFSSSITNSQKQEVRDTSRAYRVLSRYTAFLALEPSDTVSGCDTCIDENSTGNNTTALYDFNAEQSIQVYPNPFSDALQIVVNTATLNTESRIIIYDVTGRIVNTLTVLPGLTEQTIVWNGDSEDGNMVAGGVYFIEWNFGNGKVVKKVLKR
ncbi:MAG: T9SS type A sorting domain-containing protein [Chitinophagales bacterium]|nr:T9SS type A sorting domain-containing protein [Chitinophagales bacterium]